MKKGEQTRQRIIEAAAVILNQHGYSGSGMADLMRETGLAKGGLYRHFDGKEALAAAAFDHAFETVRQLRFHVLDSETNAIEKLKKLLDSYVSVRSPIPGGCPILNTGVEHDDGNSLLFKRAQAAFDVMVGKLTEIVQDGQAQGEIRTEIVPQDLALFLFSSLEGAVFASRLQGSRGRLQIVVRQLKDYLDKQVKSSGRRNSAQSGHRSNKKQQLHPHPPLSAKDLKAASRKY